MKAEIVVEGILFGEGPVWCADNTVVITSVAEGALYRIWPQAGIKERIAVTKGGANAAAPASDGGFLVAQNGGMDFKAMGITQLQNLPDPAYVTPSIQRVSPQGEVTTFNEGRAAGGFRAPNDLIVGRDGSLYFTDPGDFKAAEQRLGRVFSLSTAGELREVAADFHYCNGIALDKDDQLVVVEERGLQRVFPDGSKEWVIQYLGEGGGDGFCVDNEGRYYVASTMEHGIRIVDTDGTILDFLAIPGQGLSTNCCFGGVDGRTLFVTDALPGNLVAFEGMPYPGAEIFQWSD